MPMVKIMPAIPGRVSVAPNIIRPAIIRTMFSSNATTALIPEPL